MNAIKLLEEDHSKVKELFSKFRETNDPGSRHELAKTIFKELDVHTALEEEIFHPAVKAAGNGEEDDLVAESMEEHHVVDLLMKELREMDLGEEQYTAKFTVLMENVEHHIEEEESEMLPDAEQKLGDQADQLGERMSSRKEELMAG